MPGTSPRIRFQIRARTTHGKIKGYEVYNVETRQTISAHPVDEKQNRDGALTAARSKCAELNTIRQPSG